MKHNCILMNHLPVKQYSQCASTDFALEARSNKGSLGSLFPWDFKDRELSYSLRLFWKDFQVFHTNGQDTSNTALQLM